LHFASPKLFTSYNISENIETSAFDIDPDLIDKDTGFCIVTNAIEQGIVMLDSIYSGDNVLPELLKHITYVYGVLY